MKTIHILKKQETGFSKSDIAPLCNVIGVLTFLFLMIYFLIMRAVGLSELYALRDFNFLFLASGILLSLYMFSRKTQTKIEYLTGIKIGIRVTITAVLPFAIFIYYYLNTDYQFMNLLKAKLEIGEFTSILGEVITPIIAAIIICLEGLVSGCIITFIAMQYLKNKSN